MKKQDYLEMYKFHKEMNDKIENELDIFERLDDEIMFRVLKNNEAMAQAKDILKRHFKTFGEEIERFCKAA